MPVIATIEDLVQVGKFHFHFPVVVQHLSGGGPAVEGTFVRIETTHDLERLLRAKADERDQSTPLVLYVHAQDPAIAALLEQQFRANGSGADKECKPLPSKDQAMRDMRNNNEKLGLIIDIKVLEKFYDIFKTQGHKIPLLILVRTCCRYTLNTSYEYTPSTHNTSCYIILFAHPAYY